MAKSIFQLKQEEELKKKVQSGEKITIAKPQKMSSSSSQKWSESAVKVGNASNGQVAAASHRNRQTPKQPKKSNERWYAGANPTETEVLARIADIGSKDAEHGRKLYSDYERAKNEGHWNETYDKATSPYLAALGIEDPSQVNDDFFAANADLLRAGVHTSTGALSTNKKYGADAVLASQLSGLYSDYNATKDLKAEQDQIVKEAQYWMNKGLSDDEIKQKLNVGGEGSKYKKIGAALDNAKLGKFTPTTDQIWAATSWGVDGMLFSLRNPDQSTGNYFNDAVQRDMGRGKTVDTNPVAAAKRDRANPAWAPYANGTTMDDEAIRFGVTEFAPDWAEKNRAAILASGDEGAIKAFGKVMEAEAFTQQAEDEAEAFREVILREIEAGTPPEEIFQGDFLDGYDALEKLYDGYMSGAPSAVTRSVDFDIAEYKSMAETAYAKQKGAYTTDEYEANMAEATGGTHIPDETKQKVNEGFNLDYNILLPQYAPIATDRERQAFRVIANAGYSDVVYVSHDMIANGTGGKPQMDASLQKSAISFASENIASAIENMNINVLPAADYLSGGTKDILTEMFPDIIAEGRVPTEDDYNAFMEQNFSTPDSLFSPERQLYEASWMQTLGDRERAVSQAAGEEQKRVDGQKLYEDIKAEVAGAFGEDTEDYRAVMATYEAAMPYARGVPRVWNAFDEYQLAAGTEGMTPDGLNAVLTNQRGQNARNIKFLQAQVNNFKEMGLPQNFIDNAQQQLDDLIVQNELLGAHRLAENEDFASVGKAFDDAFGSVPPQFTQVSRDEMIRNAIMNPEAAIAFVNSQAGQQGAMSNFSELHEAAELATVMEPEELEIYKYKYGKEGPESATAYFEALSNNLAVRSAQEMSENVQEWAKQNELTSAVATVGSVLMTPLEVLGSLDAVLRMAMGEEVNWYDDSFLFSRTKSDIRTGTKEGFAEAYPDNKLAQGIYNTLYDALTSAGDNLIAAASGNPVAASAIMAMSGMNSAMMDASMRGADSKQVVMYGLANAAVEFATEKMGMDNIIKAFSSGGADGVKGLISSVAENFGAEFGEEFASGILGAAVDDAIMQSMSNRDAAIAEYEAMGLTREEAEAQTAKDILTESLYGGLVGGISGGISAGASYTAGWINGTSEQSPETNAPVEEAVPEAAPVTEPETGTEQQRATSLLATAAAGDVGESQKAATTSSVLSTFGVVEEEATAASKKIVENGSMRKVLNLFKVATDPEKISAAITMAVNAAGSKCAAIMNGDINPQNALENVGKLIVAFNEDRQNKAVMAEYDVAVTESMEADATVQVLATMPPVDSSKKDAADEALRDGQEKADASHAELRAASDAVVQSHELLKQNPADLALLQKLRTDIQKRAQAEAKTADADREVAKLKDAAKKAGIEFQTQTEKQMDEARAQAIEIVKQKRAEWDDAKAEQAAMAETQRQADNETALDVDDFVTTMLPGQELSPDERAAIEKKLHDRKKMISANVANAPGSANRARFVTQMQKKFGVPIRVMDTTQGGQHLRYNGAYDPKTGSIVIDSQSTQSDVIYGVLLHELTHKAERSDTYQEFASAILRIKYGTNDKQLATDIKAKQDSYNSRLKAMKALDESVDATPLTADEASREIVADLTREVLFGDEASIQKLCAEKPSVAKRMLETIKNFINKLRGVNDPAMDQLNKARELFEKALGNSAAQVKPNEVRSSPDDNIQYSLREEPDTQEIKTDNGDVAAEIIRDGVSKQYSLASWTDKEKETVRKSLLEKGYGPVDVDKWMGDVDSVASIISNDKARLDYEADPDQVMLKNNQEYVKTLDASTLCAKRLLYQGTFNEIQHLLPNTPLTSDMLLDLLNMMKDAGYETPCGVCYVESRRRHLGKYAQEWLDGYEGAYKPTLDEVTTTDGLERLKAKHPEAYESFVSTMRSKGSNNPKVVEMRTDYRGDIRKITRADLTKIMDNGGLRVQSFSDFETPHLLDMMQAVLDMSFMGLTSQAYTKVPNFAWVFGDTGIKINLSLLAEGSGLDEKGNLIFSSSEGMDFDEAMKLRDRYSQNVGTVLVGVSEDHIRAAMADPRIDYIIPFHRSGWGQNEIRKIGVLSTYTDFQDYQNERKITGTRKNGKPIYQSPGKKSGWFNYQPSDYWDDSKSGDENAATYLKLCEEDGRIPKFDQFLTKDSEGHWVAPSGYWKLLIDFKMYDNDGNGAPQQTVQPNFNMEEAGRVLNEYQGGANTLPVAYDIVDKYVSEFKAAHLREQYSLPSETVLDEMVGSYLSQTGEAEPQTSRPQGERQFAAQTMPNTEAVPEWIWREFQSNPDELNYDIDTNREQVERGWQRIQQNGHDAEMNRLMESDRFSADDTAEANLMMAMALRNDDPATFMALASKYNKEGTEAGKELQARKLFSKMTPTGARIWVAGKLENQLKDYMRKHGPMKEKADRNSKAIADQIRGLDNTDVMRRLMSGEDVTIDSSNNRWGTPINQQQQALIDHYNLNKVARPGIFYNRATLKQRMLEAILATPNPLAVTGNGLNLIQRLELMQEGAAVITNADIDYIGMRMGEFMGAGQEAGGRVADVAIARAYEAFGNITPATFGEKARTWRYISMLTSVPSAIRNVIGNASQNLVNATAHGIAVELDKIVANITGARTAAHLSAGERVDGWKAFVEETKNTFRDYFVDKVTTQRGNDKYNTNQRGRVYQSGLPEGLRNVEGFLMSFGDRNMWRKAYINSLSEQQKLADQNLLFNEDGTTRTHEQMIEQAELDANYATFTEDNQVSNILSQLKKVPGIGVVVDYIMPFTGVPANITRRMIQYSPIGIATTALKWGYDAANGKNFNQQAFVNGLSRGLTGTALFGVGMLLAQMGAIKMGTGEEEDKKKYGLQTAMGQQYTPYIYNPFTDEYVSLAVFSPAASAITMGGAAWMDFKDNDDAIQALQNAAFGSIDQIFDASYMTGLKDLFGGYGSIGENLMNSLFDTVVSQNVPTILGQLANTLDPYVRDTKDKNYIMQSLKSGLINKIPFLREQLLPEKVDVTGQTVRTKEGLRNFYDPFTTTDARQDPVVDELFRLNEALGTNTMLPSDALSGTKNTLTLNKQTVTLDGKGKEAYRKRYGELWMEGGVTLDKKGRKKTVEGLRELMESRRYQRMSDEEKAEAIKDIIAEAKTGATMEAIRDYGPDKE